MYEKFEYLYLSEKLRSGLWSFESYQVSRTVNANNLPEEENPSRKGTIIYPVFFSACSAVSDFR